MYRPYDARFSKRLITCLCVLLLLTGVSFSQAVFGSINGTITDPTGAAVPNANVVVTDTDKGASQTVRSNQDGNYLVEHLIPDHYKIHIEAAGFSAVDIPQVQLSADTSPRVDVKLQVGASNQTIEVTAEAPQLKTDRADVSNVLNTRSLEDLPNLTRNTTSFVLLTPGTTASTFFNSVSENPQESTPIAANGQSPFSSGFILDGADDKESFLGVVVINPPLDALSEMKFTTQNFDAEFGAAVAGIVTAQTKSGSNEFHGSAFEYRHSDAQEARDPLTQYPGHNPFGPDIPPNVYNLFGGSVGGPIVRNRVFFFTDYQGARQKTGASFVQTVPTNLVHQSCLTGGGCNLSEYLQGGQGQVFDPGTGNSSTGAGRVPFANNVIPLSRVSPQALNILKILPSPTLGGIANNYVASGFGIYNTDQFDIRADAQINPAFHIFGRYSWFQSLVSSPGGLGEAGGQGFSAAGFAGTSDGFNQNLATGGDYSVRPNLLTDFRFGFLRYTILQNKFDASVPLQTNLGIAGSNNGAQGTGGAAAFAPDGLSQFGSGNVAPNHCNCPLDMKEDEFEFVNNWTRISGNHSVKFGADVRYIMQLRIPSDQNRSGQFVFAASRTSNPNLATPGGLGLGTLLLGDVTQFQRFVSSTTNAAERQKRPFFYVQDSWRITPKLTLNYGLRWELYFPETVDGKGQGGFLNLETGDIQVAGYGNIGTNLGVSNTWSYFAPRVGLAYQLNNKTVIRAGYGRSYDPGFFGDVFSAVVTQNLPVLADQNLTSPSQIASVFNLTSGPPAFTFPTIPSNGLLPLPSNVSAATRPNQMRIPEVDAWNFAIQQQLTPSSTIQASYVGNKGTHTISGSTWGGINANEASVVGFPTLNTCQRSPYYAKFGWCQSINFFANTSNSRYDSMQIVYNKRYSRGLQFQTSYTLSRATANGSFGDYMDIDPRVNYGRYDFNRTHAFLLYGNYDLPLGRGRPLAGSVPHWANLVFGDFSINGTLNIGSGLPFSPSYAECSADRDTGPCRPNMTGSLATTGGIQYFQPVAPLSTNGQTNGVFGRPQIGQFGNAAYNSLTGPGFVNTDFSISRTFSITEKVRLQAQTQAFNLFNHPNLANPNGCVDCTLSSGAGRITDILSGSMMRQLQFAARLTF